MSVNGPSSRAGQWFLRSGIQEPNGGVARYYRADLASNLPISTEITGYAVNTFLYLHEATGEDHYRDRALAAAAFLCRLWDGHALPFEVDTSNGFAFFFDCGIIVRGLLAAWRATKDPHLLQIATALGEAMARDFAGDDGEYHPRLKLPEKVPLAREPHRWSRMPGCYQLKSALAWWDLFQTTGEARFCHLYDRALERSLADYPSFLPGHSDPHRVADRLHPFLYFLEGLLPRAREARVAATLCEGIQLTVKYLGETASEFERSDVYAQLLRIRLYAHWTAAAPLDVAAACREATTLAGFQITSADPRIDGGFYFGRQQQSWLPHVNPVSTAFAVQALMLWDLYRQGGDAADPQVLI